MMYQGLAVALMLGVAIGTAMYVYFQGSDAQPHSPHGYQRDSDYEYSSWEEQSGSGRPTQGSRRRTPANDKCPICLDSILRDNTVINCGHEFHTHCITMWFRQDRTCPICRSIA